MASSHRKREIYRHPSQVFKGTEGTGPDPAAMEGAAEALRAAEIEAVDPDPATVTARDLKSMNIDELRTIAKALDVPDRETITERDELLAAIRRCV